MDDAKMTETQRKFLTEYLGECWHGHHEIDPLIHNNKIKCGVCKKWADIDVLKRASFKRRTFTEPKDKQDLLEALMANEEWDNFLNIAYAEYSREFPLVDGERITMSSLESRFHHYYKWLILLLPEETAELICKWKGVE